MAGDWSDDGRRFEVGIEPGEPAVPDDESPTAANWRPGTPDVFWWRLVQHVGSGPGEEHRVLEESPRRYPPPPDAAHQAIEELKAEDPSMARVPLFLPTGLGCPRDQAVVSGASLR